SAERAARKASTDTAERHAAIAGVALFDPLPDEVRERLADELRFAPYAAGEVIVREGVEDDTGLHVIAPGRAEGRVGDGKAGRTGATMEAGQFFGEMSLLTGARRAATVIAATDLQSYSLDRSTFHRLLHEHPELAEQLADALAARQQELAAVQGEV